MLTSLFGDLRSLRGQRPDDNADTHGFAATAIMETVATEVNDRGQLVDSHQRDIVVSGSPAHAIRDHFAATRADLAQASRLIALADPSGVWAASVIKALSDASGRPVDRLHLREQGTLRTLAVIERTTLDRRNEDTLRIYHADVRAPGAANAAIPLALMEHSHLAAVVVGAMQPAAVDELLNSLVLATKQPQWRCPTLLFMLPPGAAAIANKIAVLDWPQRLQLQVLSEPLTSASSVWNALLGVWNRVKTVPTWGAAPSHPGLGGDFPIKVADLTSALERSAAPQPSQAVVQTPIHAPRIATPQPTPAAKPIAVERAPTAPAMPVALAPAAPTRPRLDVAAAERAVAGMVGIDGLLGCAVVDASTGMILARQTREDQPVHMELAAAAGAQVLRAHQLAAHAMGMGDSVDEVMTSAGPRHHVMRSVARHKGLFLFALLDKQRCNLALARYKLMEAEQSLL
jgi:hypothetical protein